MTREEILETISTMPADKDSITIGEYSVTRWGPGFRVHKTGTPMLSTPQCSTPEQAADRFKLLGVLPFEIGEGVTVNHYSDSQAHTVIGVSKSGKTLTLQRDKATLLNGPSSGESDALVMIPGGFAAHTTGTQRWSYERDEAGVISKARLTKKGWRVRTTYSMSLGRHEHYDYNF